MAEAGKPALRLDEAGGQPKPRPPQEGARRRWSVWAAVGVWYVLVVVLMGLAPSSFLHSYPSRPGAKVRSDVVAPMAFSVPDREATRQKIEQLSRSKEYVWVLETTREQSTHQRLSAFVDLVRQHQPRNNDQMSQLRRQLREQIEIALDPATLSQFLPARLADHNVTLADLRRDLGIIIDNVYNDRHIVTDKRRFLAHEGQDLLRLINQRQEPVAERIEPSLLLKWKTEVRNHLLSRELPEYLPSQQQAPLREACADLLMQLLGPDLTFDAQATQQRYRRKIEQLTRNPLEQQYAPGDLIAAKGQTLSPLQAEALRHLNQRRRTRLAMKLAGVLLITAAFFLAFGIYHRHFAAELRMDARQVTIHVLPAMIGLAIGQGMIGHGVDDQLVILWFPAALVGMLYSLLLKPRVAFVLVLLTSCLFGIVNDLPLRFLLLALAGGFAAVLASRLVRTRWEVLVSGMQVGVVSAAALLALTLLVAAHPPSGPAVAMVFLNGVVSACLTLVLLTVFEKTFGLVTELRLLELTGHRSDLLRRLERNCPGTYQHVLNVTKLAEAASEQIRANTLLVRAGAMYHDIGKLVKPKYFSENQVTFDDKKMHGKLSPYMSVLIIKNHVKEGIEMGRRAGLPEQVVAFIPEHHGTSLIRYFWVQALRRYENSETLDPVHENDFRYPGPKPQSKETAIVLLADTVEAIASSKFTSSRVNANEVRRAVEQGVSDKFHDGQFDECDLTLRQLYEIREAMITTLMARYHFRVAYPAMPKRGVEAGKDVRGGAGEPIAIAGPAPSGTGS